MFFTPIVLFSHLLFYFHTYCFIFTPIVPLHTLNNRRFSHLLFLFTPRTIEYFHTFTSNIKLSYAFIPFPPPSPNLLALCKVVSDQTQRRACYCFLCLSEYEGLPQRNTLCCYTIMSFHHNKSVISQKTYLQSKILASQNTHHPVPHNVM